jgi:hypothetical protein
LSFSVLNGSSGRDCHRLLDGGKIIYRPLAKGTIIYFTNYDSSIFFSLTGPGCPGAGDYGFSKRFTSNLSK